MPKEEIYTLFLIVTENLVDKNSISTDLDEKEDLRI